MVTFEAPILVLRSCVGNSPKMVFGSWGDSPARLLGVRTTFSSGHAKIMQVRQSDSLAACAALVSDMTHIFGFERSQFLLLPEAVAAAWRE